MHYPACQSGGWLVIPVVGQLFLTFMEPCIARCVFYITNEM